MSNGVTSDNCTVHRTDTSTRDKGILILLATLLGSFGVDRFYRDQIGLGILKLLTAGGCGIWALIDGIIYMVGALPTDAGGKWIIDGKTRDQIGSGVSNFSRKDKGVLVLLATLLGIFGVDRFYRGQIGLGIVKLLTVGVSGSG
jgi:TM2 domain-containing membrane protein YozV